MAEQTDVAGIALRIVGTDKAQQCALARTVSPAQCPSFTLADGPRKVVQYGAFAVANAHIVEAQYLSAPLRIEGRGAEILLGQVDNPFAFFLGQGGRG